MHNKTDKITDKNCCLFRFPTSIRSMNPTFPEPIKHCIYHLNTFPPNIIISSLNNTPAVEIQHRDQLIFR